MTKLAQVNSTSTTQSPVSFRGAFIDSEGREIPITERMIQEACRDLEAAANTVYPRVVGKMSGALPGPTTVNRE